MSRVIAEIHRRRFLVGAIALAGVAVALEPSAVRLIKDFTKEDNAIDPGTRAAMVRMARLLYPHAAIPDSVYGEALDQALSSIAGNPSFANTLRIAERALNAQQQTNWIDLDEASQIAAMKAIERSDAFITIQLAVQVKFYNHPAVWAHIGYEGPSFDNGGYIGSGAGVVSWLPEGQ